MDRRPTATVLGQRVIRMQVELEHQVVVPRWRDPWRTARPGFGRQVAGRVATQVAVDGAAVDSEQFRHLSLRVAGLYRRNDTLTEIQTLGAHADRSFPEPLSISPAPFLCKPL
jgi:hypothetical protein